MPVAAVPNYLGTDFSQASPGLRFGRYLQLWGINSHARSFLWTTHDLDYQISGPRQQERGYKDENKVRALNEATRLGSEHQNTLLIKGWLEGK